MTAATATSKPFIRYIVNDMPDINNKVDKHGISTETRKIVCTLAYLIGVKSDSLNTVYGSDYNELISTLCEDTDAMNIRCLCSLRTTLMLNFKKTDIELKNNLTNIDKLAWFDKDEIDTLSKNGIQALLFNKRAADYILHFNTLIANNVAKCRRLFPDWINWEYIKSLFTYPQFSRVTEQKREFDKFLGNIKCYPFQRYIYWKDPTDCGNLLESDKKFLEFLYKQNKDKFTDFTKCVTAAEDTKENIYNFINDSDTGVIMVIDCENSDVFKFCSMLRTLEKSELEKITKIMLFDDPNTSDGWDYLGRFTEIPIEHIEVGRINYNKSLVDMRISTGVCREHYKDGINSFILFSSDSDYWAMISSLPDAKFLVVIEHEKCGKAIKDALEQHGTYYCALDEFGTGDIDEFKRVILITTLRGYLPNLMSYNGKELAQKIFAQARIEATTKEIMNFYERYIKTIQLVVDKDGNFEFDLKL